MSEQTLVTEIPSSLKQFARLVVYSFYPIEDALIIDILVRNPCMKEDDICELLKFDKKMLRSRITGLKNDKFIQIKLRMETGADGKAQKVNYYFINYRSLVNVVKYKLDSMRKRMETEERNATSRCSFVCKKCNIKFTDLEADKLFDPMTMEFCCIICHNVVDEDESAMSRQNSRELMVKFNEQMRPLDNLLREVESYKLAPELLDPSPVDLHHIMGTKPPPKGNEVWSGELTRNKAAEETKVNVTIGEEGETSGAAVRERPVWLTESTVIDDELAQASIALDESRLQESLPSTSAPLTKEVEDNIMSVLLQHEKDVDQPLSQPPSQPRQEDSGGSECSGEEPDDIGVPGFQPSDSLDMDYENVESEDDIPSVSVGGTKYPITDITPDIIQKMSEEEKNIYINVYQDYYSGICE